MLMAMSALAGLAIARKWQREATQGIVIERCVNITTDIMPKVRQNFLLAVHVKSAQRLLSPFKEAGSVSCKHIIVLKNTMKTYKKVCIEENEILMNFRAELKFIKALSWQVNANFNAHINTYDKLLGTIVNKEFELDQCIFTMLVCWNGIFDRDDSEAYTELVWGSSGKEFVDAALKLCTEIIRLKEDLNKLIERMNMDEISIFEVFEPKQ